MISTWRDVGESEAPEDEIDLGNYGRIADIITDTKQ